MRSPWQLSAYLSQSKQLLTNRRRSGVSAAACNNLGRSTSEFVTVADTDYLSEAVKSCAPAERWGAGGAGEDRGENSSIMWS